MPDYLIEIYRFNSRWSRNTFRNTFRKEMSRVEGKFARQPGFEYSTYTSAKGFFMDCSYEVK
jgi:hypothetical protein